MIKNVNVVLVKGFEPPEGLMVLVVDPMAGETTTITMNNSGGPEIRIVSSVLIQDALDALPDEASKKAAAEFREAREVR